MNNLELFLDSYGLAAIFAIMLLKAIGVPIPIPADVVMLATAARIATGKLDVWTAFLLILLALVIGGVVQFDLIRRAGRNVLYRFGRYFGLTPARLDQASASVQKSGVVGLSVAILTPGVRGISVAACGLAGVPLRTFAPALLIGSASFLALHFFLGALLTPIFVWLTQLLPLPLLIGVIVVLLAVGFGVWYIIRRRQRPHATQRELVADALEAWHEATCPVCLALGAANRVKLAVETD
jgi:membrane protein DedA with SNARE-associated domain